MMPFSYRATAMFAALSLPGSALAQSVPPCMTRAEAQNVVQFALPDLITGMRDKCAPGMAPTAFLPKSGAALASRYQPAAVLAWPKAKPVALRMAGDMTKLLAAMPDESLKTLARNLIGSGVSKQMPTENCESIDRIMEAVAPLPAENMARLMVTLVEMQGKNPPPQAANSSPINICSVAPAKATVTISGK